MSCVQCFEEAVARHQGMKDDYHVAAFSFYEMGMLLSKQPQVTSSEVGRVKGKGKLCICWKEILVYWPLHVP